jgi:hypothetical protein
VKRGKPIQAAPWQQKHKPIARPGSTIDPALRQQVREREHSCCALCGEPLPAVWECHHRKLRSRGGTDSICNLIALDNACHRRVHGHPAWALEHGFMVSTYEDPATVPVAVHLSSWRLLLPDGTYRMDAA